MEQSSQQMQPRTSDESLCDRAETMIDIERKKLFYLERIMKEQEKTNLRLNSIIEYHKRDYNHHERMIDLLYHIAYSK